MIFVDAGNTEYLKLSESKINTSGLFKLTTFSDGNGYINPLEDTFLSNRNYDHCLSGRRISIF